MGPKYLGPHIQIGQNKNTNPMIGTAVYPSPQQLHDGCAAACAAACVCTLPVPAATGLSRRSCEVKKTISIKLVQVGNAARGQETPRERNMFVGVSEIRVSGCQRSGPFRNKMTVIHLFLRRSVWSSAFNFVRANKREEEKI